MAMQIAEVLGIAAEDIKPSIADTDSIGYSSGAGGSGVTFKMGTAVYNAGEDISASAYRAGGHDLGRQRGRCGVQQGGAKPQV